MVINDNNLQKYVAERYGDIEPGYKDWIPNISQILQRDFEKGNNCTITAIAEQLNRFTESDPRTVYETVKLEAIPFGYDPDKRGTNPLTIGMIARNAAYRLCINNFYTTAYYFKPFI